MRHPAVEHELIANAQALRALARDLVGADDADDLVQETALRALGHPPDRPLHLGAWLGTILRNLAGNHRRAAGRRAHRHAALPPPAPAAAADETAARRESLQAVTQALLALAEPYRTALFQRYFEDLSPTAIARAANVPLATVKSRLQRGLALLRAALDAGRQRQAWRRALGPAVGLAPFSVPRTTTVLLMGKTGKLVAAAALAAGLFLLWPRDDPTELVPVVATAARAAPASGELAGASPVADPTPARESTVLSVAPTDRGPDLDHPFAYTLRCRVIDRDGLPVEGASVLLAPRGTALNTWPVATDADGVVDIDWQARVGSLAIAIGVRNERLTPHVEEVELHAGTNRLVLLGQPGKAGTGDALAAAEEPPCQLPGTAGRDCSSCHVTAGFRGLAASELLAGRGLHPHATFGDLLLPEVARAEQPPSAREARQLERLLATAQQAQEAKMAEALSRLAAAKRRAITTTGVVTGVVYDEQRQPVAGALVSWGETAERPRGRTRSRKDGSFRLEGLPPANVVLRAGGDDAGLGTAVTATGPGAETRCDLHLHRGASIAGRVIGSKGPLVGWSVEYVATDGTWNDLATVRNDGTFRFANLPGPGRVALLTPYGLAAAIEPFVLPDTGATVFDLRVRGEPRGALRLRPVPPKELATSAEIRVWQVDSRKGTGMRREKSGAFVLDHLAAGFYRIEIGAEWCGWTEVGPVWVDAGGVIDLGTVTLPPPGDVMLSSPPAAEAIELYQRRPEGDLRVESPLGGRAGVALPAGDWLAFWKVGDRVDAREFTIRAGRTTVVDPNRR